MKYYGKVAATLAVAFGYIGAASDASAWTVVQCESSVWFNKQLCSYNQYLPQNSSWAGTTTTTSNSARTAHALTITLTKGAGDSRFIGAMALDGSGNVIPGGSGSSIGPTITKSFSTSSTSPPRRLRTFLGTPTGSIPATPGVYARPATVDVWPSILNTKYFKSDGSTRRHCRVNGLSDSSLEGHTASALAVAGDGGCGIVAINSSGVVVHSHTDYGAGTPTVDEFYTSAADRPRTIIGITIEP